MQVCALVAHLYPAGRKLASEQSSTQSGAWTCAVVFCGGRIQCVRHVCAVLGRTFPVAPRPLPFWPHSPHPNPYTSISLSSNTTCAASCSTKRRMSAAIVCGRPPQASRNSTTKYHPYTRTHTHLGIGCLAVLAEVILELLCAGKTCYNKAVTCYVMPHELSHLRRVPPGVQPCRRR